MRRFALAALFVLGTTPVLALDANAPEQCATGPIEKIYGGTPWLVASCSDGKSLVFVAKDGSQAAPFEFDLAFTGSDYDLAGHGKGDQKFAGAAYGDLQKLTGNDVLALLNETKAAKPKKN